MQMFDTRKPPQTFRDWMEQQYGADFDVVCEGLVTCGGIGGFSGMMTHAETSELYEEFEIEIWEALSEEAEGLGLGHPLEFIAGLNGAENVFGSPQLWDLLVWYMAGRVAGQVIDRQKEDEEITDFVAEKLMALAVINFPVGSVDFDQEADDEDPCLDVRLQLFDGTFLVWSGDNQYDTDHRGAWGFEVIRPGMTEAGYRMTAKAMVMEARAAEEEHADVEDVEAARREIDQRKIARDTYDPAKQQ